MTMTVRNNNSGTVDYLDNGGNIIYTLDPINRKMTFASGAQLDLSASTSIIDLTNAIVTADIVANAVTAAKLTSTLATGYIPLPLAQARKIVSNDIPNIAASGGLLASDTDPKLIRINGATDPQIRIQWAAASVIPVTWSVPMPRDVDTASPAIVNVKAGMGGATDTPVIAVGFWPGVGGANQGGNTGALSSTLSQKTVSVAGANVGTFTTEWTVILTPAAHGADVLNLTECFLEYTRK
jgi:hypothetical protein